MADDAEVKFGASIEGLSAAVEGAKDKLDELTGPVRGLMQSFSELGEVIIAALAIERLAHWIETVAEMGERAEQLGRQLGMSVEDVTRLGFAAETAGVSTEQMALGMDRLAYNMTQAQKGTGNQAEAFEALGLSVEDSSGHLKSLQSMMGEIADKFAESADGPEKTAIAIALFGRAGAQLIPILDRGRDGLEQLGVAADRTGTVLTTEAAEAMARTHAQLVEMNASFRGVSITLFEELEPAIDATIRGITQLVEDFNRNLQVVGPLHDALVLLKGAFDGLVAVVATVSAGLQQIWQIIAGTLQSIEIYIKAVAAALADLASGDFTAAANEFDVAAGRIENVWKDRLDKMQAAGKEWVNTINGLWRDLQGPEPNPYTGGTRLPADSRENAKPALPSMGTQGTADTDTSDPLAEMQKQSDARALELERIRSQGEIEIEKSALSQYKEILQAKVDAGQMTSTQMIGLVKDRTEQEYQLELSSLQREQDAAGTDIAAYQRIYFQILLLKQQHARDMAALDQKEADDEKIAAQKVQQEWQTAFQPISRAFDTMVQGILMGTQTVQQAMLRAGANMVVSVVEDIAKMLAQWVAYEAAVELINNKVAKAIGDPFDSSAGGLGALIGSLFSGGSQQMSETAAEASLGGNQMGAATLQQTAGDTMMTAATLQQAAADEMAVSGGGGGGGGGAGSIFDVIGTMAEFDVGSFGLPRDMVAKVHQGEMIIPAGPAQALRNGAAFAPRGLSGGDGMHLHFHNPDPGSTHRMIMDNRGSVAMALRQAHREGHPATR